MESVVDRKKISNSVRLSENRCRYEMDNIDLIKNAHAMVFRNKTGEQKWLFPNNRRPIEDCMTATTINRCLERMGYGGKFSAHGFRSTASTILNERGYRPDVIERQLAHSDRNTIRGTYNMAEYLPERRNMMQEWADLIDKLT